MWKDAVQGQRQQQHQRAQDQGGDEESIEAAFQGDFFSYSVHRDGVWMLVVHFSSVQGNRSR